MHETKRQWVLRPPAPNAVREQFPDVPPLIVQILHSRGIADREAVAAFLAESPPPTADPLLMKGVAEAVDRLVAAARAGDSVAVYGDYDADGITAAALLTETFAALGIKPVPYIPTRAEGYGLNAAALRELAGQGIRLVVTVDCGINSVAEVEIARSCGMDVIVTDHHRIDGSIPAAIAVINPRQPGCAYPFKDLAAVGVAFKLAHALLLRLPPLEGRTRNGVASRLLDLVALGTVADVAPLLGENRALVRHGLAALNGTTRLGIRALIESAGLRPGALSAGSIGFALGPRLNAAGRMNDAGVAFRLLIADSEGEARALASELESVNRQRQLSMEAALQRARAAVLEEVPIPKLLMVAQPGLPAGIVGLVAGRLAEEYHRPALVAELGETECRGSARSVDGFNVAEALASCRDLLTRFGGHALAAGFTVPTANLAELRARLIGMAGQQLDDSLLVPRLLVDAAVPLKEVSLDLQQYIARLAPFGFGNPTPVFLTQNVRVVTTRIVGREPPGHLKLQLHDGDRYWTAIGWRMGQNVPQIAQRIDIVYTVERNDWEGRPALDLHIRDWRPATF